MYVLKGTIMNEVTKRRKLKQKEQLGMDKGTARNKLVSDILWELLKETNGTKCFVCNEEMTRDTFSIEHIIPWANEPNAKDLFFNLSNISFSHLSCNIKRSKCKNIPHGTSNGYTYHKCRCRLCKDAANIGDKKRYTTEKRRMKYQKEKEKKLQSLNSSVG